MAGDLDCRKYTSRYLFTFAGGVISWQSAIKVCSTIYYRSRVYCSYRRWKRDSMDETVSLKTGFKTKKLHSALR